MQEKLTKILSEIGGAIEVARDLMLEIPSEAERTEAIQATIAHATKIIEACSEASKEHRVSFSILDHTMRFPDLDDEDLDFPEAKLVSDTWWDSSSRHC